MLKERKMMLRLREEPEGHLTLFMSPVPADKEGAALPGTWLTAIGIVSRSGVEIGCEGDELPNLISEQSDFIADYLLEIPEE